MIKTLLKPGSLAILWLTLSSLNVAQAQHITPSVPFEGIITMDVKFANGGGGTWRCPSVQRCYIQVLRYEARGAEQYCESIEIKRNGRVIWYRKY